jgi:cell division protein FtsN
MRFLIYLVIGIVLVSSSCARKTEERKSSETVVPIREVEEKLVPIAEVMPNSHHYFVIFGSFRNPENAKKYQRQILKEGFSSEILKNENGLNRVSVLATDEINVARDDIRRIRNIFPKYFDTWLLIQKK